MDTVWQIRVRSFLIEGKGKAVQRGVKQGMCYIPHRISARRLESLLARSQLLASRQTNKNVVSFRSAITKAYFEDDLRVLVVYVRTFLRSSPDSAMTALRSSIPWSQCLELCLVYSLAHRRVVVGTYRPSTGLISSSSKRVAVRPRSQDHLKHWAIHEQLC